MKRYILLFLTLALCLAVCVSCKGKDAPAESTPAETNPPAVESNPEADESEAETCDHDFSGVWNQDELYHWQECSKCGHSAEIDYHIFELAFVEKAPTENEDGSGFYACKVCGALENKMIPAGTILETE